MAAVDDDRLVVRPDARKSLQQLRGEWENCVACALGTRRLEREGSFVFGTGTTGGVMIIGEGPGVEEERSGTPFVGMGGSLLRRVLEKLGLRDYYVTNVVACRSCVLKTDAAGGPIMRKNWQSKKMEVVYEDEPPLPPYCRACLPRLYEEIYLVDPTVIVGLGKASEVLTGHTVNIARDRGEPIHIEVPGASWRAKLTEKEQKWLRRTKEGTVAPVEQNVARYYLVPTLHPAYVLRKLVDQAPDSPFAQFVKDLRTAIRTHEIYREMVLGIMPTTEMATDDTALQQEMQELQERE